MSYIRLYSRQQLSYARRLGPVLRRILTRINVLSARGPVSGKREVMLLVLIPAATFGAVYLASGLTGVAYRPSCNSASNFLRNLLFQPRAPSTCTHVPFLSDIPTVILSITCPFALVAYKLLRRRLASLASGLNETGLLKQPALHSKVSAGVSRLGKYVDLNRWWREGIVVACVAMTIWLYTRNLADGHLFDILAQTASNGHSNEEALKASWWANYHYHPFLGILCISIGSVGVYYGVRVGWLYLMLAYALWKTRNETIQKMEFSYVPRWQDQGYGWSPVTGALFLIYMSTINFAVSMVAVYDMLQNKTWTLWIALSVVALGVIANLSIIALTFFRMLGAHSGVEQRLRARLVSIIQGGSSQANLFEDSFAAADLVAWRKIPVSNFGLTVLKIVPGIYALIQFIRSIKL